ncbi:MAG: hypothetical protein LBJ91_00635 [Clostridiales Family XIII bacterium]|nr:hypothetical protein [Clostridiales Family XIII bacterium]
MTRQILDLNANGRVFRRGLLRVCVAALLVCGAMGAAAPDFAAEATPPVYQVALTIRMGGAGSACPELRFVGSDRTYIVQAVSRWYVDGKRVKDPWPKFYGKGWTFGGHSVTVVMKKKLANGAYRVSMDNGSKVKYLGNIKVESKDVSRTFSFAG